uniref:Secreted protein n=1 Tax=Parascaris equorum TaxID=6256 RepID=A0A914RA30_PAREQ
MPTGLVVEGRFTGRALACTFSLGIIVGIDPSVAAASDATVPTCCLQCTLVITGVLDVAEGASSSLDELGTRVGRKGELADGTDEVNIDAFTGEGFSCSDAIATSISMFLDDSGDGDDGAVESPSEVGLCGAIDGVNFRVVTLAGDMFCVFSVVVDVSSLTNLGFGLPLPAKKTLQEVKR